MFLSVFATMKSSSREEDRWSQKKERAALGNKGCEKKASRHHSGNCESDRGAQRVLLGQRNYQEGEQQDDGVEPAVEKRVNGIKRKQEKLKERQEFAKKKGNWHRSDSKQELVMEEGSWRAQGRTSKA